MNAEPTLPAMHSWQEFLDRADAPDSTPGGHGRTDRTAWPGATWQEALRLARDGWTAQMPAVDLAVARLHARISREVPTRFVRVAGMSGSEVDVAAYLDGVPECMTEIALRRMSAHGRVVTFLVPTSYSNTVDHDSIAHRGRALCALCAAVVGAGHSVEVWSGYACSLPGRQRCHAVAKVISAGEPFDPARLMFAMAHPAMLRRLWFGVWDAAPPTTARALARHAYGYPPYDCRRSDLPAGITDAYVLPHLTDATRWRTWDAALAWSLATFEALGLLAAPA